jgi:outer membrane protein OmpA-like peptidoglycan-associated protein
MEFGMSHMQFGVMVLFALVFPLGPALAKESCPSDFRGQSASLTCTCSAEETRSGYVWGHLVYTSDSRLCAAARHAGAVGANGGVVTVIPEAGRDLYSGTTQNGVTTLDYGSYGGSFRFQGTELPEHSPCPSSLRNRDAVTDLTCSCDATAAATGDIWGSGVYTADSDICRAALHAGVITVSGGTVSLRAEAGRPGYRGSFRNGVTSRAYDSYHRSFRIEGAAEPEYGALCPERFTGFAAETETLTCLCTGEAIRQGNAWGDGTYTSDSAICRAALHAGTVSSLGGQIRVMLAPGQERYAGSNRNGVVTSEYGPWPFGFTVEAAAPRATAPVQAPLAESIGRDGAAQLYITFRTGSHDLDPAADPILTELRSVLEADPELRLALIGHSDSVGREQANMALSMRRSEAVRDWLVSRGIASERLSVGGRGQLEPIATNESPEGRALNRRVQAIRQGGG